MKRMEHETLKHAIMVVADLYKAAGVSVFKKVLIPVQSIFSFKAKAFSFCLFCYPACHPGLSAGNTIREF
jgi:hypothetical protein